MNYDLNNIIHSFECSINWLKNHRKYDVMSIEKHIATLNYLKELKELKEKIDNPTGQVIVADHHNDTYDVYKHYGEFDLERYLAPKPAYTDRCGYKSQNHKIKKVIHNGPATIIFWNDNTKTVVKNYANPEYDKEKGILYAAVKKLATKKEYNDILRTIDKAKFGKDDGNDDY